MKVISLKEPYATIILIGKKKIETRSWKTNYGHIICKCTLVDCIYMTEEYVEEMKNNNYQEYLCGEYKVGRYAWILENIIPLKEPIKVKDQLGIWNYCD